MTELRIKDLARLNIATLPETTDPGLTFRYVDISAATEGHIAIPELDSTFASAPSRARRLAEPGDVVVSTVRTYLRAIATVPDSDEQLVFSTGFAVFHPARVDARFLGYLCRSQSFVQEVEARSVGVSYPAINPSELAGIRVAVPAREEQRRIADYLDAECARLDHLVELRQREADLLRERSDAIALQCLLLNDAQVSAATNLPGLVPQGWRVGRLKNVATRVDVGIAEAATHAYASSGVPLIRSTNIRANRLETEDLLHITHEFAVRNRAKTVHAGDILTVRTGSPGVSAVVPENFDGCQTFTQLITTIESVHVADYFCAWLNAGWARSYFASFAWGSAQRNISVPILANAPVPIPPRRDQTAAMRRLADELAPMTRTRELLDHSTALLRERKQALITATVSGVFDASSASGRGA